MLKVIAGVAIGYLLFSSPQAREITAGALRSGADMLDPKPSSPTDVIEDLTGIQLPDRIGGVDIP